MPESSLNSFRSTNRPNSGALPSGRDFLTLLTALETSLYASQSALLARDLPLIEQLTAQQDILHGELSVTLFARDETKHRPAFDSELAAIVLTAEKRLLHLARVQRALLERAQQSLRLLHNAFSGRQALYAPRSGSAGIELSSPGGK